MDKLLKNSLDALAERVDEYREADEAWMLANKRFLDWPADETRADFDEALKRFIQSKDRVFFAALVTASQWREV